MYFPASAAIASRIPALAAAVEQLDDLIYQTGSEPLRPSVTADFLGIQAGKADRLLNQFVEHGILRPAQVYFCRRCDIPLERDDDELTCDICERAFAPSNAHAEKVFFAVEPIIRVDVEPADDATFTTPLVIQFIAGDRGGAQQAQIQAPREHRQIYDSLERSTYRSHFTMGPAIFAATANEIALAYTVEPAILHFAGHGDDRSLSVIRDRGALVRSQLLTARQLQQILTNFPSRVSVCLLNACDSAAIAEALTRDCVVDIAIGWEGNVPDDVAIEFATNFYRHLGEGLSYGQAFGLAQACSPLSSPHVRLCHAQAIAPATLFAVKG